MGKPEPEVRRIFCAAVGAGMCGVSLGTQLLKTKTLSHDELRIFDRNNDFGGVWKSNTYPGVACDIPSHAYAMRMFLNADWSKKFSEGKEIQQYYARMAEYGQLRRCTIFNTIVHEARWNNDTFLWEILVEDLETGAQTKWLANVLFDNGGGFHRPKYPNIPGRESFRGEQWHTAQWPEDADIKGKRVALVGTGPSSAQVGPRIQPLVKKLYMYQRSPGHVLPRDNMEIPQWTKFLFKYCYPFLWLYHVWFFLSFCWSKNMWLSGSEENKAMYKLAISHLESQVKDPIVREQLRPTTEFACKRPLLLDDWYPMFNQPNVELVIGKPVRITERGILTKSPAALTDKERAEVPTGAYEERGPRDDGVETEREVDVIIWGTGFDMVDQGGHYQVYGLDGVNLSALWGDYPKTYWSVAVSKFPNFFITLGPNSTNYWSNITTVVEIQINYHCKVVKAIKQQLATSRYACYPKEDVQENFNTWLRVNRGSPAFLSSNCATYHVNPSGATPMHNHYFLWNYYWKMLWPTWTEWEHLRKPKSEKA